MIRTRGLSRGFERAVAGSSDASQHALIPHLTRVARSLVGDERLGRCVVLALVVVLTVARVSDDAVDAVGAGHHRASHCNTGGQIVAYMLNCLLHHDLFCVRCIDMHAVLVCR